MTSSCDAPGSGWGGVCAQATDDPHTAASHVLVRQISIQGAPRRNGTRGDFTCFIQNTKGALVVERALELTKADGGFRPACLSSEVSAERHIPLARATGLTFRMRLPERREIELVIEILL